VGGWQKTGRTKGTKILIAKPKTVGTFGDQNSCKVPLVVCIYLCVVFV